MNEPIRLRDAALEWRAVDDEVLVLDGETSTYVAVNRTGAALWPELAAGATRDRLVAVLVERFDVTQESAARDVDAFVEQLEAQGFLAPE